MRPDSQNKLKRGIVLAMLALTVALFAAIPIASANGVAFRVKGEIEDVLGPAPSNPCTGEAMEAYGDAHLIVYETGAGYALHVNGAGSTMVGVDSGTFYRFNGALNEFKSADDDGYHSVHHFTWFSPSNGDAFIATYAAHTTVNGNGEITANFDFLNGGCM